MDMQLARRLALRTGGSGLGQGAASDDVPFTEAVLPWLRLGDLTVRNLFAPAIDLRGLPFEIDIVLGYNVLRHLALRIDYREQQITLTHPDLSRPATDAIVLPLIFFEHFPTLEQIQIDGLSFGPATLDTGSNGAITVGPDFAERLGMQPGAPGMIVAQGAGFGGTQAVLMRRCNDVRIGPLRLTDIEVDTHQGSGDLGRSGRANIGNRLLSRFAAVEIDYERRQLCIEP